MDYSNDSRVKSRKRKLIVTVAMQMFHKYGIADTSMFDVAKETKIGRSTFYEYFNSKEELVAYVRYNYLSELYAQVVLPEEGLKGYDSILQLLHKYMDVMLSHKDSLLFFFDYHRFKRVHDMPEFDLPEVICDVNGLIMETVEMGIKDGSISSGCSKRTFMMFLETLIGAATRHAVKFEGREDPNENFMTESELHELVDVLIKGVKA